MWMCARACHGAASVTLSRDPEFGPTKALFGFVRFDQVFYVSLFGLFLDFNLIFDTIPAF